MRDVQKARLYKAEQAVRPLSQSTGSFSAAVSLIEEVQESLKVSQVFGDPAPLSVAQYFGTASAFYTPGYDRITLPPEEPEGSWAYNRLVILHEIAHHLSIDHHGPRFAGAFLYLTREFEGDTIADALAASFTKHKVRVISPRVRSIA
jgi:putative metallohydrolase (TIGR04338 family)